MHFALNRTKPKPFLAIHLEEVNLPDSVQLQVGRIQAIRKHTMSGGTIRAQLSRWLPIDLREGAEEPAEVAAGPAPVSVVSPLPLSGGLPAR